MSPRKSQRVRMAEVIQTTQEEFWSPPVGRLNDEVAVCESHPAMAEACRRCGTEFLLGSRFCYSCGGRRPEELTSTTRADAAALAGLWERGVHGIQAAVAGISWSKVKLPVWTHQLHFQEIKSRVGLSTLPLIAFVIGLACVAGALFAGLLPANRLVDWEAVQYYRAEWLLAATACFVAGILLKKPSQN